MTHELPNSRANSDITTNEERGQTEIEKDSNTNEDELFFHSPLHLANGERRSSLDDNGQMTLPLSIFRVPEVFRFCRLIFNDI